MYKLFNMLKKFKITKIADDVKDAFMACRLLSPKWEEKIGKFLTLLIDYQRNNQLKKR